MQGNKIKSGGVIKTNNFIWTEKEKGTHVKLAMIKASRYTRYRVVCKASQPTLRRTFAIEWNNIRQLSHAVLASWLMNFFVFYTRQYTTTNCCVYKQAGVIALDAILWRSTTKKFSPRFWLSSLRWIAEKNVYKRWSVSSSIQLTKGKSISFPNA